MENRSLGAGITGGTAHFVGRLPPAGRPDDAHHRQPGQGQRRRLGNRHQIVLDPGFGQAVGRLERGELLEGEGGRVEGTVDEIQRFRRCEARHAELQGVKVEALVRRGPRLADRREQVGVHRAGRAAA
jgi:hypothetical protein